MLTASGRVLSMGQWSKMSSVREVRPVRAGHQGGLFGPMSPSQLQFLNTRLFRAPKRPTPAFRQRPRSYTCSSKAQRPCNYTVTCDPVLSRHHRGQSWLRQDFAARCGHTKDPACPDCQHAWCFSCTLCCCAYIDRCGDLVMSLAV